MLWKIVSALISEKQKRFLKTKVNTVKIRWAKTFFGYNAEAITAALKGMGVLETDTLMVHANFEPDSGFEGTPTDLVTALVDLVGKNGNLMMVSIPFRGSAYDYLLQNKPFHIKKTVSMMGLVTEMFRRKSGTVRSLHPTHPVLVYGKDSAWTAADHATCLFPCGIGTPFDKFLQLKGKILFFDVGFGAITFFHYVEDRVKDKLPFPVYYDQKFSITVIGEKEDPQVVHTYAFTKGVVRDAKKLEEEMARQGKIVRRRVGNSRLILVNAEDVVSVFTAMVESGNYPYAVGSES
jgi:aminoglycoside N3'-acetyltransferase